MRVEVAGKTHVGMKRAHNEDGLLLMPDQALFAVCDGMGGHSSGEVASKLALDTLTEFFGLSGRDAEATWPFKMENSRGYDENRLLVGLKLANRVVFERSASDETCRGMGTTAVALHFAGAVAFVGHVGDSRAYRFRGAVLEQLTEDHSLFNAFKKGKNLSQAELDAFPQKNVIMRALGINEKVDVDVARLEPSDGDVYLLCSDGLSGMVPDAQVQEVLARTSNLDTACAQLIDLANANGGVDNITCILARYCAS